MPQWNFDLAIGELSFSDRHFIIKQTNIDLANFSLKAAASINEISTVEVQFTEAAALRENFAKPRLLN